MARYQTPGGGGGDAHRILDPRDLPPCLGIAAPLFQDLLAQQASPKRRRGGDNPLVIQGTEARGTLKADIVVTEESARKIRQAEASSKVLSEGKVIVVVRSDVGGVEGRRRPLAHSSLEVASRGGSR